MRITTIFAAAFAAAALFGTTAEAQTIAKGTISGVILTKSVDVPSGGAADVYTTDAAGIKGSLRLIITQVCVSEDEQDLTLDGNTMGQIPLSNQCTTFEPGLAIPQGETLTFTDTNTTNQAAMITGILVKK